MSEYNNEEKVEREYSGLSIWAVIILIPIFLLILFDSFASAQSKMDEMQKRAEELSNKHQNLEIPEDIYKQAEEMYNKVYGGETGEKISEYMNTMVYDSETGKIKFAKTKDNKSKEDNNKIAKNGIFKKNERIYIFISSSIPMSILENYKEYIKNKGIGDTTSFVIRGCIPEGGGFNGCKNFQPTMDFATSLIIEDKDNKTIGITGLMIDPVLFKAYGVEQVPQVVYAKEVNKTIELGSEGDFNRLDNKPIWWKSTGDWSLEYHLRELYRLSNEEKLKEIYE